MEQHLTAIARTLLRDAQAIASANTASEIGTEHLLLAILRDSATFACRVLRQMRVDLDSLTSGLARISPQSAPDGEEPLPLSGDARRAVELAYEEALALGSSYVGAEHLLLGLIHEECGTAAQALALMSVELKITRGAVREFRARSTRRLTGKAIASAISIPIAVWNGLTENARDALLRAHQEAARHGENYVGTEHLLLGLAGQSDTRALQVLRHLGISPESMSLAIEERLFQGFERNRSSNQLTPRAKRALDLAAAEAALLGDTTVGTEHLLPGLLAEGEGLAAVILVEMELTLEKLRIAIAGLAPGRRPRPAPDDSRLEDELALLRRRLQDVDVPPEGPTYRTALPSVGDVGVASPLAYRNVIEATGDAAAFRRLIAIFQAKDTFGYRAMADAEQTMVLLPGGTALKRLVPPPDSSDLEEEGYYVRIVSGEFSGDEGWVFKIAFERTGADKAEFSPG